MYYVNNELAEVEAMLDVKAGTYASLFQRLSSNALIP